MVRHTGVLRVLSVFVGRIAHVSGVHTLSSDLSVPLEHRAGVPVRIVIPRINVDASIEPVAVAPDGGMGVPQMPRNVAWFRVGVRPGEVGSAVMAGHVNWWNGATAVFADLHTLSPGDKIVVRDDTGATIPFVVQMSRVYGSKDETVTVFSSHDGLAHLNLITCDGVWNKRTKQYSKRLVVFADRER